MCNYRPWTNSDAVFSMYPTPSPSIRLTPRDGPYLPPCHISHEWQTALPCSHWDNGTRDECPRVCEGQQDWVTLGQVGSAQTASLMPSPCRTLDAHRSQAESPGAQSRSTGRQGGRSELLALGVCVPALGAALGSAPSFIHTRVDRLCSRAWRKV